MTGDVVIRLLAEGDREMVGAWMRAHWGGSIVVVHDTIYRPEDLPGFVAEQDGKWVGLVTYRIADRACEVVTLDSIAEGRGTGTALMDKVREQAVDAGCERIWLVTTNDNLHALGFYQKRGYRLTRVVPGAVDRSREIKPQIPDIGMNGIPIRDELELEMMLNS